MSKRLLMPSMAVFLGSSAVFATEMTHQEYNDYRGWQLPENEDGGDIGYITEDRAGQKNTEQLEGFVQWLPKVEFERKFKPVGKTKQLGSSVWGSVIHTDHNDVSVTHREWVDPEPSDDGDKPTYLPRGHYYSIDAGETTTYIHFQNGPVKEQGVNGATSEALLAILIHRTKVLNGNFPCDENKRAISYMENALALFEQRTKERQSRGVEGFNKV